MKILVTGSSGYIGGTFIRTFSGKHEFMKFSLQKNSLNEIDFGNIDVVLHCAALVHQKHEKNYDRYYDINTIYAVDLARLAKINGVKHFLFMSTVAVYEEGLEYIDEKTECKPETPYGRSKFEAEKQLQELVDKEFQVSIIRPPMVYGQGAPGNIGPLINLVKKINILPFGKINNKRSFVYIGNLVNLIDNIIDQKKSGVFLAADNEPLSTSNLIELIARVSGKKIYLFKCALFNFLLKIFNPSTYNKLYGDLVVNNTTTMEELDIKNKYSVEEGIKLMINGETNDKNF